MVVCGLVVDICAGDKGGRTRGFIKFSAASRTGEGERVCGIRVGREGGV